MTRMLMSGLLYIPLHSVRPCHQRSKWKGKWPLKPPVLNATITIQRFSVSPAMCRRAEPCWAELCAMAETKSHNIKRLESHHSETRYPRVEDYCPDKSKPAE